MLDAATNQCQVVCAGGRRLVSARARDARAAAEVADDDAVADDAAADDAAAAEAAVERYLSAHPSLAARMDAQLLEHMRQLVSDATGDAMREQQHFGRPALASGE